MLKPILYPYKMSSQSAKLLSSSLHCKRVYPDRNYRPRDNHLIINWGNSQVPIWGGSSFDSPKVLNHPHKVAIAANKLETFMHLHPAISIPRFSTYKPDAVRWIEQGHKVFCRTSLTSHSGRGIVIAETVEQLVDAPLYVQAVKKDKEYRVHVFQGQIIDYQQKKKREGFEGGISGIRNHANGWVYARNDIQLPEEVAHQSIKAIQTLDLDFGAVDICTSLDENVYVFEVNTAPGLHGTTLQKYVNTIRSIL